MEGQHTAGLYKKFKDALKDAVAGAVVTRFPPEPSGYLHIGHIKAVMLNFHYAKIYNGKMILRFDDTNPSKENENFVESIKQDLQRLEIFPDQVSHTSDYFPQIAELMKTLISEGNAYLDDTPVEEMRAQRNEGTPSASRESSAEENLQLWAQFLSGNLPAHCVRGKLDMSSKNKCLRDPVFYRCNETPHLHTGTTWKVYPTYDFACPIVDSLEGVTHCLRTSEYNDRNPMYHWVLARLALRPVLICDFSKLNFVNTLLSKRKLQKLVDTGVVEGWMDPRFPTVQGVLRRGLTVTALKEFMLEQGHSKRTVFMDWSALWAKNKQIIDAVAPRYNAVASENVALLVLENGPEETYTQAQPLHLKNPELGEVLFHYSNRVLLENEDAEGIAVGDKITLMKWGNVLITSKEQGTEEFQGSPVRTYLRGALALDDTDYKKTKKLHWLPALDFLSKVRLVEFDVLINKAKVEETDNIEELLNLNSRFETTAFGSPDLLDVPVETIIQLERRGYFRVDSAGVLFLVPDGKNTGMSTLSSKVDPKQVAKGSERPTSKKELAKLEKKAKKQAAKEKKQAEEE